ncbi:Uncharacterized protein KIAA1109 [Papilio xuthus]|uniref:Uncharacterized protein KIAA1109 n=1 Tax=Papilio xuthus TaxID=66420 RepID=A0A0N1IHI4_PAPXU|nr:Uncharacterized protein KIAA1109 [Papilio xuthus]
MSRSFDLELATTTETSAVPPRCPSADHLLTLATEHDSRGGAQSPGRELALTLRRGAAGFGFTIADSVHGQKVKKVLDRSRCAGLREGDLLLQIGDTDVRHAPHQHVVQVLKECPALHETTLRVWRRNNVTRAPRSRSATRLQPTSSANNNQLGRSKTPTAEQLRSPAQDSLRDRLNGMNTGYTFKTNVGGVRVDLPQHPVALHGVMTRSSRQLSSTLQVHCRFTHIQTQELGVTRTSSRLSRNAPSAPPGNGQGAGAAAGEQEAGPGGSPPRPPRPPPPAPRHDPLLQPLQLQFTIMLQSLSITAALLPSLQAQYKMEQVQSKGVTGLKAHFTVDLPTHSLSFATKLQVTEANIPAAASVALPAVSCIARVLERGAEEGGAGSEEGGAGDEGVVLRAGRYLAATADIGLFEHTLSTDLLNHLVESGGALDPEADVLVRLARGAAGFGFRIVGGTEDGSRVAVGYVVPGYIVGGTEDGSRVAVGYVVPGGPADGLLRPGDLLTSVDGVPLGGATHARAVAFVSQAASRGHVTLGVRHNRADIQPLGLPTMVAPHAHQPLLT